MSTRKPISRPLSESEGFAHIESYLRSGLRPSEYYTSHDLSEWQFYSWRKRYFAVHPEVASVMPTARVFHPVRIAGSPSPCFSGLEIHYPHGVKVVVGADHPLDVSQVTELIKLTL